MHSIPISEERKAQLEALARQEQEIREMLNRRYDDAVSGKAQLLDPDDVRCDLAARHAAYAQQRGGAAG